LGPGASCEDSSKFHSGEEAASEEDRKRRCSGWRYTGEALSEQPIERFCVPDDVDDAPVELALDWLISHAREAGSGTLWAPSVADVDALARRLSGSHRKVVSALVNGTATRYADVDLHRATPKTRGFASGPVLACWPDDEQLESIGRKRTVCVLISPHSMQSRGWELRYKPVSLVDGQPIAPPVPDMPVLLVPALKSIEVIGGGLHNGLPRAVAAAALRQLRIAGVRVEADGLRVAAILQGWPPHVARELAKLTDRARVDTRHDWVAARERWEAEAGNRKVDVPVLTVSAGAAAAPAVRDALYAIAGLTPELLEIGEQFAQRFSVYFDGPSGDLYRMIVDRAPEASDEISIT
jgi:hypothetical protein